MSSIRLGLLACLFILPLSGKAQDMFTDLSGYVQASGGIFNSNAQWYSKTYDDRILFDPSVTIGTGTTDWTVFLRYRQVGAKGRTDGTYYSYPKGPASLVREELYLGIQTGSILDGPFFIEMAYIQLYSQNRITEDISKQVFTERVNGKGISTGFGLMFPFENKRFILISQLSYNFILTSNAMNPEIGNPDFNAFHLDFGLKYEFPIGGF
ncbi:MAG: hypothetical protein HUU10_02910 [Bacteroidetes bacterium]|nr:hypothetical protein [Bacteroidota bacterium]